MPTTLCRLAIKPLSASIAVGLLLISSAHAATQVSATASYSLNGGATTVLAEPLSGTSTSYVDVLNFSYDAGSSSGIHTYGGPDGNFGSRSSGAGHYDVTGLFSLSQSITNATATAQHATFNFYITPGLLQNDVRSDLSTSGYFVDAGIKFDIKRNGSSVWGSAATLRTDNTGTQYNQTGTNIFSASGPRSYNIGGGNYSVDLGVINAGESITLQYDLSTFAKGYAHSTGDYTVAAQHIEVPEQTIFHPEYSYDQWVSDGGYGGYGDGCGRECGDSGHYETVTVPASTEVIPAHVVDTPAYTTFGEASGSHASSGDPFDIDFSGRPADYYDDQTNNLLKPGPASFSITTTAVPEPESVALVLGGLAVVAALARRRRQQA